MLDIYMFEIDGVSYEAKQLDAIQGRKVLFRLLKIAAPIFSGPNTKTLESTIFDRISGALQSASEDDLEYVLDALAKTCCTVEEAEFRDHKRPINRPLNFGAHFAGRYVPMIKWAVHLIQSNFGADFLALGLSSGNSKPDDPETPETTPQS